MSPRLEGESSEWTEVEEGERKIQNVAQTLQ